MPVFDEAAKRKIRYQTRRGLLELDIVLGRFMDKEFQNLSDEELAVLVDILRLPDQELLALVNQKEETTDARFLSLLEKIRGADSYQAV
ncbi:MULTISPECIES: succinate dehydrogenase assembly factor 2 [Neisseria]|uniref:FAD assembly factor SdhE n=1 Tax=Neisseria musculi TaxID=1815583 RepID=A0A7H1MDP8_9NEIS|nr:MULTISPECIES: succinate dehydrogenase assembly factor 2 [Neisseria]MBF0804250.1 succinate dehydrogenase assembly factor 2 [Neisseria sp. 19428wB4_WF04]QNT59763.1 flavinator of succinate dehydrogenase family protein [Neisseria musculi]TFU42984.1 succinate dehydrogenase assembly factor 2 family protein [Neisseria sp. WF04]